MTHRATPRFWRCYEGLPQDVGSLLTVVSRFSKRTRITPLFISIQSGSSGRLELVCIIARSLSTRADLVWFWIGSHADYDKLLGQKPANRALAADEPEGAPKKNEARKAGSRLSADGELNRCTR